MSQAGEAISRTWDTLLAGLEGRERQRGGEVLRRLSENLTRLTWRLDECKVVGAALPIAPDPSYSGPPLTELQLRFVDKVEAFHQHVYATLAVLALALNHRKEPRAKQPYPIGSISKFLDALKERDFRYKDRLLDQVTVLEKSADFRSKYVDHPEQHQLHDWMTMVYLGNYRVIYFIKRDDTVVYRPGSSDPDSPDFRPPLGGVEEFYVSPDLDRTYDAVQRVIMGALRLK